MLIKVGFLLAYDYKLIEIALPYLYPYADLIVFSIDKNRVSWVGNKYDFDEGFLTWLKANDPENKIKIYEDDFHVPSLKPMENESRQRNMMASFMGDGGWHIQMDSDEYFYNFREFTDFLRSKKELLIHPEKHKIEIGAFLLNIYKKVEGGYLYIDESVETLGLATNYPSYTGRRSKHKVLYTPHYIFHQSWAREEPEIEFKIRNWGHSTDVDADAFYNAWRSLNVDNYKTVRNFHPINPKIWKSLAFIPGKDIPEFIRNFTAEKKMYVSPWTLFYKNLAQKVIQLKRRLRS